jgi:uncharacterized membrane protein
MDDVSLILLGLAVVIGLPVIAISAFVMVLNLKARVLALEGKVEALSLGSASGRAMMVRGPEATPDEAPAVPPMPDEQTPVAGEDTAAPVPGEPASTPEPSEPVAAPPRKRRESLEEKLGARWAVWVGGLALALGGIFLVRYSIEAGLIGPGARILAGLVFSLLLVALGEVLRRRRPTNPAETERVAYVPGVVTAAGTAALFATVYAAHALYGFIGPGTAFVALGLVGVATLCAAALHGPWLAALGLVGSYVTPFLVSSTAPNPWALATYLLVVTAAAFTLARLRMWRWLAIAASVAAIAWGFLIITLPVGDDSAANATYILALAGLILAILVVEPHRGRIVADRFDGLAIGTLAAIAALALWFAMAQGMLQPGLATALVVAAGLLCVALAFDAVAPAAGIAALLLLGLAIAWPIAGDVAAEPILVMPGGTVLQAVTPDALSLYLAVVLVSALALFGAATARLMNRSAVAMPPAAAMALAGAFGPLALLACAYVRTAGLGESIPFGAAAVLSGAALCYAGERLLRIEAAAASTGHGAAGSIEIAGAAAALALALTMLFEGSTLTFAFALAGLASAWIADRRPLASLRGSAAAFAVLVLLRAGGAWTVVGEALTTFPGWSDIALRFALPAVALFLGGALLRRRAVDTPAAILDGASVILGTAAAALAIRLWVKGPEGALAAGIGLGEAGLYATLAFGMALAFARGALTTTSSIHRLAAPVFAVLAVTVALLGPVLGLNPVATGEDVSGGSIVNELLLGYVVPAVLAAAVGALWARTARAGGGPWGAGVARTMMHLASPTALLLAFLYVTLETRVLVSGPDMSFSDIPTAESYAYSAVWLAFGIVLLALGILMRSKGARLGSAVVIMLAVAKVFLVDMSDLEGVWRALSFIGLGAVLVGIGLVYQRFLLGGQGSAAVTETVE